MRAGRVDGEWTAALFLAAVAVLCAGRLVARRTVTLAARRALKADDPETRRAAVLVAAQHGLPRYERVLRRMSTREESHAVLTVLADAVVAESKRSRRKCRKLSRWADEFLDGNRTPAPEDPRPSHVARTLAPVREEGSVDALVVIGAVAADDRPESPVAATSRCRWRALPDGLDALVIVEAVGRVRRARSTLPATTGDGRVDVEALLDQMAGISRRPRALSAPAEARRRVDAHWSPPLGSAGRAVASASTLEEGA